MSAANTNCKGCDVSFVAYVTVSSSTDNSSVQSIPTKPKYPHTEKNSYILYKPHYVS